MYTWKKNKNLTKVSRCIAIGLSHMSVYIRDKGGYVLEGITPITLLSSMIKLATLTGAEPNIEPETPLLHVVHFVKLSK
jgi:hypothetical protein